MSEASAVPEPPVRDTTAVFALVAAIGGFVLCPIVMSVAGWVLAQQSLAAIRKSDGYYSGVGIAKTARVLSVVGIVVWVLAAVLLLTVVRDGSA